MVRSPLIAPVLVVALAAGALGACDLGPTRPGVIPPPRAVGTFIMGVEIQGPLSMAPGTTARLAAIVHWSDGTSRDVTQEIEWLSVTPSVISVAQGGVATAHDTGETSITVVFEGTRSVRNVMVLPPGTFRLAGTVADYDGFPVPSPRVEVISGPNAGLSTTVDATNYFYLYGVAGELQIRVTSTDRYRPHVETVVVRDHRTINVFLEYIGG
jgi:hypothetical protein